MASTGQSKGNELLVYVDGTAVAYCRDSTLSINNDTLDRTSKASDGWKQTLTAVRGFTIEGSGLVVYASSFGFSDLLDLVENKTQVELYLKTSDSDDQSWYGNAYLTSISEETPNEEVSTFSFSFEGDSSLRSSTWTPTQLADVELWMDANEGITITGSGVADWDDKTTNDFDATQAADTERPLNPAAIINGLPVVRFDGIDNNLDIDSGLRAVINVAVDFSIACVIKTNVSDATHDTIFSSIVGAADRIHLNYRAGFVTVSINDGAAKTVSVAVGATTEALIVATWQVGDTYPKIYLNGVEASTFHYATTESSSASSAFAIRGGSSGWWDGDIAEFLLISNELSTADRQSIEGYLNAKFSIY